MSRIYLDYASLTPIDPRVLREMKAFSADAYANPSSLYKEGVAAKKALVEGRKKVADFLNAHPDEIIFTSGGTEANGLAIEGAGRTAHRNGIEKPHLITTAIEHSSVKECVGMMGKHGVEVTLLGVDAQGQIDLAELKKAIKPSTFMVSIMTVNNELGTVFPIREIAKVIRDHKKAKHEAGSMEKGSASHSSYPLFHTDAAQALYEDLNIERLGVDLLTLDGSKVFGPRGIGALFVRRGTPIEQIIYGGGQEKGLRSGTENLPGIMGFAKALEIITKERERLAELRDFFLGELLKIRPDIRVNGENPQPRKVDKNLVGFTSPHILNVSIPGIDNEFFMLQLDAKGIACSTKSSCLRDEDESYVLKAIGVDSKTSVRFSFGRWTKKSDLKSAARIIEKILSK